MSKKKDPNIILRDKRLRALVQRLKKVSKEVAKFGCPFLDRMVDEDYDLVERVIKLGHFLWNVKVERKEDRKTGETHYVFTSGEFTDAANALDKKDRDLLVRQYKHMMGYKNTLERRMDRVYDRLASERKEAERSNPKGK